MKRHLAWLVGAASLAAAPAAFAQAPAPITPITPIAISSPPPPLVEASLPPLTGFELSSPLRLSLEASVIPMGNAFAGCISLEDNAGNSVGGIPVQHYAEIRLSSSLLLSGFSQLGCPIDAGIGGALTYAVPLRDTMSLVFGAGIYGAPGQVPLFGQMPLLQGLQNAVMRGFSGARSPVNMAARIDLVIKTRSGRPLSLGVQSTGRAVQQITFAGGF